MGGTLTDVSEFLTPFMVFPNGNTGQLSETSWISLRKITRDGNRIHLSSDGSNSTYRDFVVYGANEILGGSNYGDSYLKSLITSDTVINLPQKYSDWGDFSLYLAVKSNLVQVRTSSGNSQQIKLATVDSDGTVTITSALDIPETSDGKSVLQFVPLDSYADIMANRNLAICIVTRGSRDVGDVYFSIIALPKITTT